MRRLILTNKGFTLVELMVAVAISLVVLLAAGFMFSTTLKSSHANLRSVTLEQDLNTISEIMASELRRAGYWDDAMNNDPLANATVSGAAAPYNTYVHLNLPSATCATYYYDANSDHTVDNNDAGRVEYAAWCRNYFGALQHVRGRHILLQAVNGPRRRSLCRQRGGQQAEQTRNRDYATRCRKARGIRVGR